MPYFVCDQVDLEGHGRALVKGDRDTTDLIQAALDDYEEQGMMLAHVVPPAPDRPVAQLVPIFIFHK